MNVLLVRAVILLVRAVIFGISRLLLGNGRGAFIVTYIRKWIERI